MKCLLGLGHTDAYLKVGGRELSDTQDKHDDIKTIHPARVKQHPKNDLSRGGSGGGGSFVVRRLDSCGLGFFLGHAFGDEGAVGRGKGC